MEREPFEDVYITPIIQAPDGRRMSKSLGTGIDPLDEIGAHGADAVRFGLLAMASSQDVRYSHEKVQQGQQLANKMWNASRLVLLNVAGAEPAPRPVTAEDRWILTRLQRAIEQITGLVDRYDFAHAAQELYSFFWSELCDWYLEMVKPRLYGTSEDRHPACRMAAMLSFRNAPLCAGGDPRAGAPVHPVRHRGDPVVRPGRRG